MTVRRLLFFVALLPIVASPFIASTGGLLASVSAFCGGFICAGVVAFWPLTEREAGHVERDIHRSMVKNLSGEDPR